MFSDLEKLKLVLTVAGEAAKLASDILEAIRTEDKDKLLQLIDRQNAAQEKLRGEILAALAKDNQPPGETI